MDEDTTTNTIPDDDEDEAGARWSEGVAREWAEDLTDTRQDIYSWDDGHPVTCDPSLSSGRDGPTES